MALTATRNAVTAPPPDAAAARTTGLFYLCMALPGLLGTVVIRPRLFDAGDPAATLANLAVHETLARTGVALELVLVVSQALVALWFFKLFRSVDQFSAVAITVLGTMNAVALLGSAAFLASALDVALGPVADGAPQLMYVVSGNLWTVGNLFFGLWLIPMGVASLRSGWASRSLGRVLIVGGIGYLLSPFATYLLPGAPEAISILLILPATIGEFWMIGWLLITGLRRR